MPKSNEATGQVCLSAKRPAEGPGHLWIYAGHIRAVTGQPNSGDIVDIVEPNGRYVGRGFYNGQSKIQVRILTFEDEVVDEKFWVHRIRQAVRLRQRVVEKTSAYRLVHGEADLLPGLVVDRYGDTIVVQTLSSGMDRRKDELADVLMKELGVPSVYLRNDAKSRQLEGLPLERG